MKPTPPPPLGPVTATSRGFPLVEFADHYGHGCSLQMSSLADYEKPGTSAVWLGINDAEPKVMWDRAAALGVKTTATEGWVPYPIPEDVSLNTRMHLNREQVASLIAHLSAWLENDTFELS